MSDTSGKANIEELRIPQEGFTVETYTNNLVRVSRLLLTNKSNLEWLDCTNKIIYTVAQELLYRPGLSYDYNLNDLQEVLENYLEQMRDDIVKFFNSANLLSVDEQSKSTNSVFKQLYFLSENVRRIISDNPDVDSLTPRGSIAMTIWTQSEIMGVENVNMHLLIFVKNVLQKDTGITGEELSVIVDGLVWLLENDKTVYLRIKDNKFEIYLQVLLELFRLKNYDETPEEFARFIDELFNSFKLNDDTSIVYKCLGFDDECLLFIRLCSYITDHPEDKELRELAIQYIFQKKLDFNGTSQSPFPLIDTPPYLKLNIDAYDSTEDLDKHIPSRLYKSSELLDSLKAQHWVGGKKREWTAEQTAEALQIVEGVLRENDLKKMSFRDVLTKCVFRMRVLPFYGASEYIQISSKNYIEPVRERQIAIVSSRSSQVGISANFIEESVINDYITFYDQYDEPPNLRAQFSKVTPFYINKLVTNLIAYGKKEFAIEIFSRLLPGFDKEKVATLLVANPQYLKVYLSDRKDDAHDAVVKKIFDKLYPNHQKSLGMDISYIYTITLYPITPEQEDVLINSVTTILKNLEHNAGYNVIDLVKYLMSSEFTFEQALVNIQNVVKHFEDVRILLSEPNGYAALTKSSFYRFVRYLLTTDQIAHVIQLLNEIMVKNSYMNVVFQIGSKNGKLAVELLEFMRGATKNPREYILDLSGIEIRMANAGLEWGPITGLLEYMINISMEHYQLSDEEKQRLLAGDLEGIWPLVHISLLPEINAAITPTPDIVFMQNLVKSPEFLRSFSLHFMHYQVGVLRKLAQGHVDTHTINYDGSVGYLGAYQQYKISRTLSSLYAELSDLFTTSEQADVLRKEQIVEYFIKIISSKKLNIDYFTGLIESSLAIVKLSPAMFYFLDEISRTRDLDNPDEFKLFTNSISKPLRIFLSLQNSVSKLEGYTSLQSLIPIRNGIKSILAQTNKSSKEMLGEVKTFIENATRNILQDGLGVKFLPEEMSEELLARVESMIIFLGNLSVDYEEEDQSKLLKLYVGLLMHGKLDDFRKGIPIDYDTYFTKDLTDSLKEIIEDRTIFETLAQKLSLSEEQLPKVLDILTAEDESSFSSGESQDLDTEFENIHNSFMLLYTDTDYYASNTALQNIGRVIFRIGSGNIQLSDINIQLAQRIRVLKQNGGYIQEDGTQEDYVSGLFSLPDFPMNIENILKLQKLLKIFSKVNNINSKLKAYIDEKEQLDSELTSIKERYKIGDDVSTFPQYLMKINNIKKGLKDTEEKTQLTNISNALQGHIGGAKDLLRDLSNISQDASKLIAELNVQELEPLMSTISSKLDTLDAIVKNSLDDGVRTYVSLYTGDIPTVAQNVRECLSTTAKEVNNPTNLTFGDPTRALITTRESAQSVDKSSSDQLVYFMETEYGKSSEHSYVMDNVYGVVNKATLLSHIRLVIDKLESINEATGANCSLVIPDNTIKLILTGDELSSELDDRLTQVFEGSITAKFNNTKLGDYYCEFDGSFARRAAGSSHEFKGRVYKLV